MKRYKLYYCYVGTNSFGFHYLNFRNVVWMWRGTYCGKYEHEPCIINKLRLKLCQAQVQFRLSVEVEVKVGVQVEVVVEFEVGIKVAVEVVVGGIGDGQC